VGVWEGRGTSQAAVIFHVVISHLSDVTAPIASFEVRVEKITQAIRIQSVARYAGFKRMFFGLATPG